MVGMAIANDRLDRDTVASDQETDALGRVTCIQGAANDDVRKYPLPNGDGVDTATPPDCRCRAVDAQVCQINLCRGPIQCDLCGRMARIPRVRRIRIYRQWIVPFGGFPAGRRWCMLLV